MWIWWDDSILQECVLEGGSVEERQSGLSLHRLESRNSTGWDGRIDRARDQRDSNVFRVDVQGSLRFAIYIYQALCQVIVYLLTDIYSFHVSITLWKKFLSLSLFLFYRRGNQSTTQVHNFPRDAQLVRAGTET